MNQIQRIRNMNFYPEWTWVTWRAYSIFGGTGTESFKHFGDEDDQFAVSPWSPDAGGIYRLHHYAYIMWKWGLEHLNGIEIERAFLMKKGKPQVPTDHSTEEAIERF